MNNRISGNKIKSLAEILKIKYDLELKYGFECKQGNGSTLIETDINTINAYGIYFFIDEDENLIHNVMSKKSAYISSIIQNINNRNPDNVSYLKTYDAIVSCYKNNKKVYFYYIEMDKNQIDTMKAEIKNICISMLQNNAIINDNKITLKSNIKFAPHYQWIDYFKHLTDKILEYQNNRNEFKTKVINAISKYSKIGNYKQSGVDPLSFIYELARLWTRKNKQNIYSKVAEEFKIEYNLSNIDRWIFLNPIYNTFFYYGNELQSNNIHWDIFTMVKNNDFIEEKIFKDILEIKI